MGLNWVVFPSSSLTGVMRWDIFACMYEERKVLFYSIQIVPFATKMEWNAEFSYLKYRCKEQENKTGDRAEEQYCL